MLELTPDNARAYLAAQGWPDADAALVWPLGGGVSNAVLAVRTPGRTVVLKQSRPQLRTRDAWFSDLDRVYREQEVMALLHPLLPPGSVPDILFSDRENYAFAMSHAPPDARVWKDALLAGEINLNVGAQAGRLLGRIHEGTALRATTLKHLAERAVFVQLRVDPFYRRVQERCPDVAAPVADLIDQLLAMWVALCHGDFTPKNLLTHSQGLMLVDYETAHLGEPAMDLGLFLCHLLLKAVRLPQRRAAFFDLTRRFWTAYAAEIFFEPLPDLQARGIAHVAACLLARTDGTSPVDYLDDAQRDRVRALARRIFHDRPRTWEEVLALFDGERGASAPREL